MLEAFLRPWSCLQAVRSMTPVRRKQKPSTVTSLSVEKPSTQSLMRNITVSGRSESSRKSSIRRLGDMFLAEKRPVKRSRSRENASRIRSAMVRRKTMNTAISVPAWSRMEKRNPVSPLFPVKYWKRERCPELDTGRNSVRPCRTPCRNASNTLMADSFM